MNFSNSKDIAWFTNIIRVDTIRKDIKYIVYRQIGSSSEGSLDVFFVSENNTDVKIRKVSKTYNGCRRLRIFGIN